MYDENKLSDFRKQKDKAWKENLESPLTEIATNYRLIECQSHCILLL